METMVVIDNNLVYSGKLKSGVPIINVKSFIDSYRETVECVLITVWDELKALEMAVSLLNRNYDKIYLIPEVVFGAALF